jgi:hypothetical protein
MDKAEWKAAIQEAHKEDPYYQEERDGCPICGGALEYDNGRLMPCPGGGRRHEEYEAKKRGQT